MTFRCKQCKIIFGSKLLFKEHLEKRHGIKTVSLTRLFSSYFEPRKAPTSAYMEKR